MKLFKRCISGFIVALLVICISACGYSMSSSLDQKYQTIHVPAFKNQSREFGLQAPLTNAVIRKFINDGRLRVVNKSMADLIVDGTIIDYELKGLTFDNDDNVIQFEATVRAKVRVIEPKTGDVLWNSSNVIGDTSFSTSEFTASTNRLRGNTQSFLPSVRSFQTEAENRAAAEALEKLASMIFFRTIEPW